MFDKKLIKASIPIHCFNENNTINMIIDRVVKSLEVYNFTNYEIINFMKFRYHIMADLMRKEKK